MAVIQSRYEGGTRNIGGPLIVDFLHDWFATRKGMNDAVAAENQAEDPEELGKMELAAREELGRLQRNLADAMRQAGNDQSELWKTILTNESRERQTSAETSERLKEAKINREIRYFDKSDKEAEAQDKRIAFTDATAASLAGIGTDNAKSTEPVSDVVKRIKSSVASLAQQERAGAAGDEKYDNIVRGAYRSLVDAGREDIAKALLAETIPSSAAQGITNADDWFRTAHPTLTPKEAQEWSDKQNAKMGGAGIRGGQTFSDLEKYDVDIKSLGTGSGSSDRTRTSGSGGGAVPVGGSVSMRGNGPGTDAFSASIQSGENPYDAIRKAIEAQSKYADDIAVRRKEASANRSHRYPSANPYLANPNRYVSNEGGSAARIVGGMDPGYLGELNTALAHNNGNIDRAYKEMGPVGGTFDVKQYDPMRYEKGGDLGGWLADAMGKTITVDGSGGYGYAIDPDLNITITKSPNPEGVGKVVEKGSDAYRKIVEEVGGAHPLASLSSQPTEVQTLFAPAIARAKAGDQAGAVAAAREVSPDDVRSAYGAALQRGSKDPASIGALQQSIAALPPEARAQWADDFEAALDRYARTEHAGGNLAHSQFTGSIRNLGGAMLAAGPAKDRRVALERERSRGETRFAGDIERHDLGRTIGETAQANDPEIAKRILWQELDNPSERTYGLLEGMNRTEAKLREPDTTPELPARFKGGRNANQDPANPHPLPRTVPEVTERDFTLQGKNRKKPVAKEPEPEPVYDPSPPVLDIVSPDEDDADFASFLSEKQPKSEPIESTEDDPDFAEFVKGKK